MTEIQLLGPERARRWSPTELYLAATVLIWGVNFVVVKVSLNTFAPLAFNSLRLAIAAVLVATLAALRHTDWRTSGRDLGWLALLGLTGHTLYQYLFINGIARTSAGSASLLMGTTPIWVALYGRWLGLEQISPRLWAGIGLSVAGVALLVAGGAGGLQGGTLLGDSLVLSSAMVWAAYIAGTRPLLARHSPLKVSALSMMVGAVALVAASIPALRGQNWAAVAWEAWGGLAYSSILTLGVGYVLWAAGIQRVGSARTAVYQSAPPLVAILLAWIALGDHLAPLQLVGGAAVLAGILLARAVHPSPTGHDRG